MTEIAVIQAAATVVIMWWLFAGIAIQVCKMLGREAPSLARTVFHELRPFFLAAVLAQFGSRAAAGEGFDAWDWFNLGLNLWNWYALRNIDDDDRWQRRRKKLADKVSVLGGRLVVVPAGAR